MAHPALTLDGREDAPVSAGRTRYEGDDYTWAREQVDLLRARRRFDELDLDHVAEELEDLPNSEVSKLYSCLRVPILHMLEWDPAAGAFGLPVGSIRSANSAAASTA